MWKKFRGLTPPGPKVITANTQNLKPIFECLLSKIVGGPHPQWDVCLTLTAS